MAKTTGRKGGKRGCLGEDGTYSVENCKGELINQGIGNTSDMTISTRNNPNAPRTIVSSN